MPDCLESGQAGTGTKMPSRNQPGTIIRGPRPIPSCSGNGLKCGNADADGIGRWKYQLWKLAGTFQTNIKKSKFTVQYIATYGKRKRSMFTAGNLAHLLVFIPARAHRFKNWIFCVIY
jgi:hypothetical protein